MCREEGEECWCHTPRVGTEGLRRGGLAVSQNCPSSCSLLHQTFLVELLQDGRKQNIFREGAEGAKRKVLLCSRAWSPSFAAQESDKQTCREIVMILILQGSERCRGSIESHSVLLCQEIQVPTIQGQGCTLYLVQEVVAKFLIL